jgi:hypothetical protein
MELPRLTAKFNEYFGLNKTVKQIRAITRNHSIRSHRDGRFPKGNTPWNSGTKGQGICRPNSGSFSKGNSPANIRPFGHERICQKDGYILIKTDQQNPYTGARGWYRPKHIVIWENKNGPVPKGMVIRIIDGDPTNCTLDNLELITKAENVRLNQFKANNQPTEIKESVRMLAKLVTKTGVLNRQKNI